MFSNKMKSVGVCFVIILVTTRIYSKEKSCTLNLHGEWEKYSPLLLYPKNNPTFLLNDNYGQLHLNSGENITVVCPDIKNYLINLNSNSTSAICVGGNLLKVANKHLRFEDLQCKKLIKGTVQNDNEACGDGQGVLYKIGYKLLKNQFVALIAVCYNEVHGVALYTQHLLHGKHIKGASKTNYRPSFSTETIYNLPISLAYRQSYQKSTFNKLLGSSILSDQYINNKSYLARGHLSPDADFLLAAWQYTTYYYINTSPQWQIINGGNWKKIELLVRRTAEHYQHTFQVITGNYGVLELKNIDGHNVGIYLVSHQRLPVPRYVWKIVYSPNLHKAIAIIVVNNPFVKQINESRDLLCEDVCAGAGWNVRSFNDPARGFVYCCDYRQFVKVVKFAPTLNVNGILRGIN